MTESASTPRRGEELPEDHPLAVPLDVEPPDCAADVPAYVKDELVEWYRERGIIVREELPEGVELE